MKKIIAGHPNSIKLFFLLLIIFTIGSSTILLSIPQEKLTEVRTKAAGNTITVCPEANAGCSFVGGDGIQQAIDSAQNGDIIQLGGTYTRRNPTVDKNIKYERCMVNTRGKKLTLKGPAVLYGENGGYNYGSPTGDMIIGICDKGGDLVIDNIQVKQTLRPAFYFSGTKAVMTNVSTNDIDNVGAEFTGGSVVSLSNSVFGGGAGPGVVVSSNSYARIINNTFSNMPGGISFDTCSSQPTVYIVNNIFDVGANGAGINVKCPDKFDATKSRIAYNLLWKGTTKKDDGSPGDLIGCGGEEMCNYQGFLLADPKLVQPIVFGDTGWYGADWNLSEGSPGLTSGEGGTQMGVYGNPCSAPSSDACLTFNKPLEEQPAAITFPTSVPFVPPDITTPNNPTQYPLQPTLPSSGGGGDRDGGPPITYYLPPTMSFESPDKPRPTDDQPLADTVSPSIIPTITPTPKPLIDIAKSIENTKNSLNNLWNSFINFTKTILP